MGDLTQRLESPGAAAKANDLCVEIDPPPCQENAVTADDWRKCLKKVVPAVVVLRITGPRFFDTETTDSSCATGFVVDKRRGIILTNRHVVKPGKFLRSPPCAGFHGFNSSAMIFTSLSFKFGMHLGYFHF